MISAIFAIDDTGAVGVDGGLPWPPNKDDMKWFREKTTGGIVAMGKRTWDSVDMPKPLPGRTNVVFTNEWFDLDSVEQIRGNACDALLSYQKADKKANIFVIGGVNLLEQCKPILNKVYLTRIPGEHRADTYINIDEFLQGFDLVETINLGSCVVEEYNAAAS